MVANFWDVDQSTDTSFAGGDISNQIVDAVLDLLGFALLNGSLSIGHASCAILLVSGSYDKTVRLWNVDQGRSRDVYHTKRMQRLTSVAWTLDNKYILSGSDEMNIRLWKARASEKLGIMRDRERVALQYSEKLKEKYGQHPQISRIARHRHE